MAATQPLPGAVLHLKLTPDRQILSAILGDAVPESHPCWLEPDKACCGSGRCKSLGF